MIHETNYDQKVYDLCESFLKDNKWFADLVEQRSVAVIQQVAEKVQQVLEDAEDEAENYIRKLDFEHNVDSWENNLS